MSKTIWQYALRQPIELNHGSSSSGVLRAVGADGRADQYGGILWCQRWVFVNRLPHNVVRGAARRDQLARPTSAGNGLGGVGDDNAVLAKRV